MTTTPDASTLRLPRILCLHGGGVNATIFRLQLRSFLSHPVLSKRFRFVFAEAPFTCSEAVGIGAVYADFKPFRRWFRWLEDSHPEIDDEECRRLVMESLERTMREDAGTGEWAAVLGFSQGAKLAASLLYEQQLSGVEGPWKFGVIFAGRAPLVALGGEESRQLSWLQRPGGMPEAADMESILERPEMRLTVPTVHVHGMKDEGLHLHRKLVDSYCAPGTLWLVEWDGAHRLPIKKADVDKVVEAMIEVADEYGIGDL